MACPSTIETKFIRTTWTSNLGEEGRRKGGEGGERRKGGRRGEEEKREGKGRGRGEVREGEGEREEGEGQTTGWVLKEGSHAIPREHS